MTTVDLLSDAFDRIREGAHGAVDGLTSEDLSFRPDPAANSIAWLVWHLARVQDDHLASAANAPQVWVDSAWHSRFALPFDVSATGYGQTAEEMSQVHSDAETLTGYLDAVSEATHRIIAPLSESDLEKIVDRRWDPPVTMGVRLVSVISDDFQHVGQAAYVRGLLLRR